MKRESIEEKKAKRKKESVYGVLCFAGLQVVCAAAFGSLCFIPDVPRGVFWCFLVLAVLCLLLIVPALLVLRTRFKEIEGGELDAAGQY